MWPFKNRSTWKQLFDQGMKRGTGGNLARADSSFRAAIKLAPEEPYPHYELGYTLFLRGRIPEALAEFERTENLRSGFFLVQTYIYVCRSLLSQSLTQEGYTLFQELQWLSDSDKAKLHGSEARKLAEALVKSCENFPLGHYFLGMSLLKSDPEEAEAALRTCLGLDPDATTAIYVLFNLGELRNRAGDRAGARDLWRRAVESYPGNLHTKLCEVNLSATESD